VTELQAPALIDPFQREIRYLRISVTDRCDFRCVYCMAEDMKFLPRSEVLSLEEIERLARVFVGLGVRKIRLTGGEPLVRRGLTDLVRQIAQIPGLDTLAMTSNGARLAAQAAALRQAGLQQINISLDSLDPDRFQAMTRTGELADVLAGIDAAIAAGFSRIRLNAVILQGRNDQDVLALVEFARAKGIDLAFIEEMPLGVISDHDRAETMLTSAALRAMIALHHVMLPEGADHRSGPATYYRIEGSQTRLGFISPHSHNFCGDCNRVRLTAEGRLLLCLGHEHSLDLRAPMRAGANDGELADMIRQALLRKPERHEFDLAGEPQIVRFMNMTGG
jgi:cyclic pyranopterin phosphate synthase